MRKWLAWLFRRGTRGTLLLNMQPGDGIAAMTSHRGWLIVASRYGEIYMISTDKFASPYVDDVQDAIVHSVGNVRSWS